MHSRTRLKPIQCTFQKCKISRSPSEPDPESCPGSGCGGAQREPEGCAESAMVEIRQLWVQQKQGLPRCSSRSHGKSALFHLRLLQRQQFLYNLHTSQPQYITRNGKNLQSWHLSKSLIINLQLHTIAGVRSASMIMTPQRCFTGVEKEANDIAPPLRGAVTHNGTALPCLIVYS